MSINLNHLQEWVGRQEQAQDQVYPTPVRALALTLDTDPGALLKKPLRPLWHWLYFLPLNPLSEAGTDGHTARGGFLPPVPLPRRMWAGSEIRFHDPIAIGDSLKRKSTIQSVEHKKGRSGDLLFVTVNHQIYRQHTLCIDELHHIVYRDLPAADAPHPVPPAATQQAQWSRTVTPDPVLLFRYSALTFNSHRIHYDAPYTIEHEGYPGLVVHGPLIATLLMDLLHEHLPGRRVEQLQFRAISPVFTPQSFSLHGRLEDDQQTVQLWAQHPDGGLVMSMQVRISST